MGNLTPDNSLGHCVRSTALLLLAFLAVQNHASAAARILPIGDSITRGTNDAAGDIPGGYRKKLSELLAASMVDFDFVGSRTDNAAAGMDPDHSGVNGQRTDEMTATLPALLGRKPDTVLLMTGTNDILQGVPVTTAVGNLRHLIETLALSDSNRRVHVSTILRITQDWEGRTAASLNAKADEYNIEVRELVQEQAALGRRVSLVDMNALLVYTDSDPDRNVFQPGDGIHPGQAGYDQMAEIWHNFVNTNGSAAEPPITNRPTAPTALAAGIATGSRINLSWTDLSANEKGFKIYRRTGFTGAWELIAVQPANSTSYAMTGLLTGVNAYQFAVSAAHDAADSPWSNLVSTSVENLALNQPASASSIFSVTFAAGKANDGDKGSLWSSGGGDSSPRWTVDLDVPFQIQQVQVLARQDIDQPNARRNFEVRGSNDPAFGTYSVLASQGVTSFPHASALTAAVANPAGFRYLRVAKTDTGSFTFAEVRVFGTPPAALPPSPSGLASSAMGSNKVVLFWSVNSLNESAFKLERLTGPSGTFEPLVTLPAATTTFTDYPPATETAYSYRLRATNETGDSAFSNITTVTTGPLTAYDLWAANYQTFSGLPPNLREPAADPNNDGVSNLLCYASGVDPLTSIAVGALPPLTAAPEGMTFTYRRNKQAPELLHEVLVSSDPSASGWTVLGQEQATVAGLVGDQNIEEISVPIPPDPEGGRRFARLRVTR